MVGSESLMVIGVAPSSALLLYMYVQTLFSTHGFGLQKSNVSVVVVIDVCVVPVVVVVVAVVYVSVVVVAVASVVVVLDSSFSQLTPKKPSGQMHW